MERNWLDRFSGYSTPSGSPPPHNRSYSPAPKRPTHLGAPPALPTRPSYSPRSSSLSLGLSSNASTTSLPGTSRLPNGSALRQEISAQTPPNVADPLTVLAGILGDRENGINLSGAGVESGKTGKPAHLVEDIEFGDLSLQDFIEQGTKARPRDGAADTVRLQNENGCTFWHCD